MSLLQSIREKINLAIYDNKYKVLSKLNVLSFIASLIAVGALIYYYGFPTTKETRDVLLTVIKLSFAFYIIRYLIRIFYSFEVPKFLKETWFEGLLMLYLVVEGISFNFFGTLIIQGFCAGLGIESSYRLTTIFIQLYFLLILGNEIGKVTEMIPRIKMHPAHLFLLTFLIIILLGTAFLLLPEMTVQKGSMSFIDALFTSASAVTTTGLAVVDTATYFTFKGHFLIMLLMKLGGLNTIAFGTFFALISKFGIGLKQDEMMEDFLGRSSQRTSSGLLAKIIVWSVVIEVIGALIIYPFWPDEIHFKNTGEKVFYSIFHSISAFNNGGFSLLPNGFYNEMIRYNYLLHTGIILLMFLGSLGMMPIFRIFSLLNIKRSMKFPWKRFDFSTKITLYFTIWLIIAGTAIFFLLERNNTLQDKSFLGAMVTSLFQSVTARNTGLNTVDIAQCTLPMILIFLVVMFVGGASASTAGGIRISTFALLFASARATITGKRETELFKRTIHNDLIYKAFSVFMYFVVGIFAGVLLLSYTEAHILAQENRTILDLIFEEVSAFTTTGLSTGITSELSDAGKFIAIVSMFIGRVGTLSVVYIFSRKLISTAYKYPEEHILVG